MSTPTPGPWRVTDMKHTVGRAVWAGIPGGLDEYRVCGVGLSHVPGRMEANAALIAAAPVMYEYIARSASNGCAEASKILEAIHASR